MSQEEVLTGKAKKAKRSEERYKKGKKRKQDDVDEPAKEAAPSGIEAIEQENLSSEKKSSSKKRKRSGDETNEKSASETAAAEPADGAAEAKQQKKKKRRKSKPADAPTAGAEGGAEGESTADAAADGTPAPAPKNQRFIVFIGNLPFTATTEGVTAHFASIQPTSVRHMTEPGGGGKSKGYAFLEFANYDRMKTCLKLYHHSMFDSGVGGERGQRRINVELTAGGGGAGGNRKEKLKVKNARLEEQRKTRAETQAKQEKRKAAKGAKGAKGAHGKKNDAEDEAAKVPETEAPTEGIHPARLAMLNKKW
ncbi:hypothetical protein MBLNU459_g6644t1 [Dothideomycetes sp. NU459]